MRFQNLEILKTNLVITEKEIDKFEEIIYKPEYLAALRKFRRDTPITLKLLLDAKIDEFIYGKTKDAHIAKDGGNYQPYMFVNLDKPAYTAGKIPKKPKLERKIIGHPGDKKSEK